MTFTVKFTAGARIDLREASAWYEEKAAGLGAKFSEAVQQQSELLEHTPEKYRIAHRDVRRCSVPRFPYAMYYRVVGQTVLVLLVHGVRQEPNELQERLERS